MSFFFIFHSYYSFKIVSLQQRIKNVQTWQKYKRNLIQNSLEHSKSFLKTKI